jgi:DNA ligase-1
MKLGTARRVLARYAVIFVGLMCSLCGTAVPTPLFAKDAPPILLANALGPSVDVTKYLVSEKYDGVRGIWDGTTLRFRSGNVVNAPAWFLAKLPPTPLDGELWLARGKFETLSGIVRKSNPIDEEWRQISYMIFEMPNGEGSFAARAKRIEKVVADANWPQLKAVTQTPVESRAALQRRLDEVVRMKGEGLMLHLADAPYLTGRSDALLKLKRALDTEAVVVAHIPGKGKYNGMLGALRVRMPSGVEFKIGTGFSDVHRRSPPAIGSTITYTYRDLTKNGIPRFASFLRERIDP